MLETSSTNHFLKGELPAAIEDGKQALKVAAAFPDMKDLPDVHLTLYGAYKSSQDDAKAAEHLQRYIVVGNLSPDELANRKQEVTALLNKARANGQIISDHGVTTSPRYRSPCGFGCSRGSPAV